MEARELKRRWLEASGDVCILSSVLQGLCWLSMCCVRLRPELWLKHKTDLTRQARRLATALADADDIERLLRYAEEFEAQAADLDRHAATTD